MTCMTCGDDDKSSCTHTHTHTQTDRTTNLLISFNVHYVHLGDVTSRFNHISPTHCIS